MNMLLIKDGLAPLVVQVAERKKYIAALCAADAKNIEPFVGFIANSAIKTLDVLLDTIEKELKLSYVEDGKINPG